MYLDFAYFAAFQSAVTEVIVTVDINLTTMDLLVMVSLIGVAWRTR